MQIRILFEELLARFPNIHSTSNPVRIPSNFLAGISELKVSL
jgi:cytochrome P450